MTDKLKNFVAEWKKSADDNLFNVLNQVEKTSDEAVYLNAGKVFIERFFGADRPYKLLGMIDEFLSDYYDVRSSEELEDFWKCEYGTETNLSSFIAFAYVGGYRHYDGYLLEQEATQLIHEDTLFSDYMTFCDDYITEIESFILEYVFHTVDLSVLLKLRPLES